MRVDKQLAGLSLEQREKVCALAEALKLRRLDTRNDPKRSDNGFWIGLAIRLSVVKGGAEQYMDYCRDFDNRVGESVRAYTFMRSPATAALRVSDQLHMLRGRLKAGRSIPEALADLGSSINPVVRYSMASWGGLTGLAAEFRPAALEFLAQYPEYATCSSLIGFVSELRVSKSQIEEPEIRAWEVVSGLLC